MELTRAQLVLNAKSQSRHANHSSDNAARYAQAGQDPNESARMHRIAADDHVFAAHDHRKIKQWRTAANHIDKARAHRVAQHKFEAMSEPKDEAATKTVMHLLSELQDELLHALLEDSQGWSDNHDRKAAGLGITPEEHHGREEKKHNRKGVKLTTKARYLQGHAPRAALRAHDRAERHYTMADAHAFMRGGGRRGKYGADSVAGAIKAGKDRRAGDY
jgi:hypothetical protein